MLLAFGGQDFIGRIRRIGPGGVELEAWQDITRIPEMAEPPDPEYDGRTPWSTRDLSPQQRWFYERGSSLIFHLHHRGVDAYKLQGRDRDRYRRIVLWVARAALNQREYFKAFETLQAIEHLPDLNYDELFFLAVGYWFVAPDAKPDDEERDDEEGRRRRHFLQRARRLLERATKESPSEAQAHWALGYIYDELGQYDRAIQENRVAIEKDSTHFHNWGYWNMAVSHLKKKDTQAAIAALEKIPAGEWWDEIRKDKELAPLEPEGEGPFGELCRTRAPGEDPPQKEASASVES